MQKEARWVGEVNVLQRSIYGTSPEHSRTSLEDNGCLNKMGLLPYEEHLKVMELKVRLVWKGRLVLGVW